MFGIMKQSLCKKSKSVSSHRFNYCGTCKSIGSLYHHKSRVFLNYDIVFLSALLNEYQNGDTYTAAYANSSCWSMPEKDKIPKVFQYTAALNVYLAGIKTSDNIKDEKFPKRVGARFANLMYSKKFKAARTDLATLDFPVEQLDLLVVDNFEQEEKKNQPLEAYVKNTGEMTRIAFQYGASLVGLEKGARQVMSLIGESLGKLVYLIDALDDYVADKKANKFNPLLVSTAVTHQVLEQNISHEKGMLESRLKSLNISDAIKNRYLLQLSLVSRKYPDRNQRKEERNRSSCGDQCCVIAHFSECCCTGIECCTICGV